MVQEQDGLSRHRKHGAKLGVALRVLVAGDDATLRKELGALLAEQYAPAVTLDASDVPSATEALLVRHPDLVITDLRLTGHTHGGLRLIIDAVSLGVPTVVTSGRISRTMEQKLAELGAAFVQKGSTASALFAAVDRVLARRLMTESPADARRARERPRAQAV